MAALGVAVVLALACGEALARFAERYRPSAQQLKALRGLGSTPNFMIDPEFGFRPVLDSPKFDEHGVKRNDYAAEKDPARKRVLFIGDSVTHRGRIIAALRERYGDERFEYWNAGVESFSLVQTVNYFLLYTRRCDPDHVVLTFHNNDFQTTPVTFVDGDGKVVVYAPTRPREGVNDWLFRWSYLYRRLLKTLDAGSGQAAIEAEMRDALARLKAATIGEGVRLSVVVFPVALHPDDWKETHRAQHDTALAMCRELELETHDLEEPLVTALAEGVEVAETPGDTLHPSDGASAVFARFLEARGLLDH